MWLPQADQALFYVRAFDTHAQFYNSHSPSLLQSAEREKKAKYVVAYEAKGGYFLLPLVVLF